MSVEILTSLSSSNILKTLAFVAAILVGAIWGFIPGIFKSLLKQDELKEFILELSHIIDNLEYNANLNLLIDKMIMDLEVQHGNSWNFI